jgi:hypothetical protein
MTRVGDKADGSAGSANTASGAASIVVDAVTRSSASAWGPRRLGLRVGDVGTK